MKEKWKKVMRTALGTLFVCMLMVLVMPGTRSEAAVKKPVCAKTQTVYISYTQNPYVGNAGYFSTKNSAGIYIKHLSSNAQITNIRSSNKKVKVTNYFNSSYAMRFRGLYVNASGCKAGTKSKITFRVKQNGKTYSLSCTVIVKKEPARFTKLSIGGKNYASKVTGYSQKIISLPKNKKVKISVQVKSGMKLDGIYIINGTGAKKIKNGSSVKLSEGNKIYIEYKYTKKPVNYSSCLGVAGKDYFLYGGLDIYVK